MILHITVNIDRKGKLRNKLLADKIFIFQFVYYFFPIVFHNPYPLFLALRRIEPTACLVLLVNDAISVSEKILAK